MIKLEIKSEIGTSSDPAKVLIYQDGHHVATVTASIEARTGADGGNYPTVQLHEDILEPGWVKVEKV